MVRKVLPLLLCAVLIAGCAPDEERAGLDVVASFYPLAELALQVGGDTVSVENLTAAGVEPHDVELTPNQVAAIESADVVFYLGQDFQPAVERAVRDADGIAVDLLEGIDVRSTEGEVDAHVWLSPRQMNVLLVRVEATLIRADGAHAERYRRRASAYRAQLDNLDSAFSDGLATCERKNVVTSHAAFAYMTADYGLTQESISGLHPDAEPSPNRLIELTKLVQDTGTTTIFYETLVPADIARTLAREAGVGTAVLNPLEALTKAEERRGEDYLSIMRGNLAALRKGLDCS